MEAHETVERCQDPYAIVLFHLEYDSAAHGPGIAVPAVTAATCTRGAVQNSSVERHAGKTSAAVASSRERMDDAVGLTLRRYYGEHRQQTRDCHQRRRAELAKDGREKSA